MDLSTQFDQVDFVSGKNAERLNFLDLRFSNLPLDYLNGVLPTAQFGSESVVSLPDKAVETGSAGGDLVHSHVINQDSLGMSILSLRQAYAAQKYKEIQLANDPDFANQVLAHFGIKPKVDARTSVFIGGDDKTLSINPQVNTNFLDGGQPDIKAIGVS